MRGLLALELATMLLCGCAANSSYPATAVRPAALNYGNPIFVKAADPQYIWENVEDVVDDYFRIEREEPSRLIGDTITEGRIDTFAEVSPTVFEPWRMDTAEYEQRVENTFQSIRRKAAVRVIPTAGGFWIEVAVQKELEDVARPEQATAGAATMRYDNTLTRVVNPMGGPEINRGWIAQGRDAALEQVMLRHIQSRLGCPPAQPLMPGPMAPARPYAASTGSSGPNVVTVQSPITPEPNGSQSPSQYGAIPPPIEPMPPVETPSEDRQFVFPTLRGFVKDAGADYRNFYTFRDMALLGAALGTGAVLANTSLDQNFQNWYQSNVRSGGTDNFASIAKQFGNGNIFIPIYAGTTLLQPYINSTRFGATVGEWGDRSLRTAAVGGPPVLVLQYLLGGSRPTDANGNSHWKPFNDTNSVSGHAFIGAVTFVNAAKMSDNIGSKIVWYALSTLPAWSRINDNDHYLSQAILGWSIGYLAATAVDETQRGKQQFAIVPTVSGDGMGVGAFYQW
jgi:membrane-associated phospholipid phosphatase